MSELLLTDEELKEANRMTPKEYGAPPNWWLNVTRRVTQAQLDKILKANTDKGGKIIDLLEDKDAHFTANWVIADQILDLLNEEVSNDK